MVLPLLKMLLPVLAMHSNAIDASTSTHHCSSDSPSMFSISAYSFHPLVVFVFVVISFNLFIIGKKTLLVGQVGELVRGCHLLVRMMVMMVLMMMTMGRSENWLVISPGL